MKKALAYTLLLCLCAGMGGCVSKQEAMTVRCMNGNMIEISGIQTQQGKVEAERWDFTKECALNQSTGKKD